MEAEEVSVGAEAAVDMGATLEVAAAEAAMEEMAVDMEEVEVTRGAVEATVEMVAHTEVDTNRAGEL